MSKKEIHHIIPISLLGEDIPENTMKITKEMHNQIHKVLNIHYKWIRKLRILWNSVDINRIQYEKAALSLQKEYFRNLPKLPDYIVKKHIFWLLEQITYYRIKYITQKLEKLKKEKENEILHELLIKKDRG